MRINILRNRRIQVTLIFLFVFLILFLILSDYIQTEFSKIKPNFFYSLCEKAWAHKGYTKKNNAKIPENSLLSFNEAVLSSAKGTELDIFYDVDLKDFIVSHNFPYEKIEGKLLTLKEVFKQYHDKLFFWLDFKNLAALSDDKTKESVEKMLNLLEKNKLSEKVIIESPSPRKLSYFVKKNIHTSYWIALPSEKNPRISFVLMSLFYKLNYLIYGNFSAFSMRYDRFSEKAFNAFKNVPFHLFTVNDKEKITQLMKYENIKIILTDENYFNLNSCEK
ncbi:MAG: glycerophosphodiester phosphodiesterase [Spirochaetia bacterium]|nr:glycerophosphodiester phosphodiesterase [Spirochaetia bacterium]